MGMTATLEQLAWYIERDGATTRWTADGLVVTDARVQVRWLVPESDWPALDAARDRVYTLLRARERSARSR
jgi:hypothetical protein